MSNLLLVTIIEQSLAFNILASVLKKDGIFLFSTSCIIKQSNFGTVTTIIHDVENKKISSFYKTDASILNTSDCSIIVSSNKLLTENSGNIDIFAMNQNHFGIYDPCIYLIYSAII